MTKETTDNGTGAAARGLAPRIASCPARDCCFRSIRHENPERWVFCRVRENVKEYLNPLPAGKDRYTGFPKNDLCEFRDGRKLLQACSIYLEAVNLGFIQEGRVLVMSEFLEYKKTSTSPHKEE